MADIDGIFDILKHDHSFYLQKTEIVEDEAARVIQRTWKRYRDKRIFEVIKTKLVEFLNQDPVKLLRWKDPIEAELFDKKLGYCLVFRMDGSRFPPTIVYKVFISANIKCSKCDKGEKRRKGKSRMEWKVFYTYKYTRSSKRVLLKRNVIKKRKRGGIQWIKQMYQ